MQRIDPAPLLALPGVAPVLQALPGARIVGGAVRDLLAGRPVHDVDIATPLRPDAVIAALGAAGLRVIPTGLAHGTVTAIAGGASLEITTLRQDLETDGRHAVVAFTDDFAADAARRDFTINAMSLTADGTLFDYFAGREDLAAGRVRFVGAPAARIAEDYLRVLRYFRFQIRYGRRPPDAATAEALAAAHDKLGRLSAERVWSEMKRILGTDDPRAGLGLMAELGILAALLPEASADWPAGLDRLIAGEAPAEPVLRLAALIGGSPASAAPQAAEAVARRWKLSTAERGKLAGLGAPPPPLDASDAALRQALAETPKDRLIGRVFLHHPPGEAAALLRRRIATMPVPVFPLHGRDGIALGLPPGPALGAALAEVRRWWLARGCRDDAQACRAALARVAGRARS
ncbi:CCA tRNA nucleotidyltransferase [Acidisoma sp. C75]